MQAKTTTAPDQTEPDTHPHRHASPLFHHDPHPHQPRNINLIHEAEKAAAGLNQRVAMGMTQVFQSMITFWIILIWIVGWILFNLLPLAWDRLPWPLLLCLASVPQLPLMIVIMVGQGLLGRKQELQADEQFRTTMSTYHDIEGIMKHLVAQDAELLRHAHMLIHLLEKNGVSIQQLASEGAITSYLNTFIQTQPSGEAPAAPAQGGEQPPAEA
jgi:uncharacterized membrane protein